MIDRSSPIYQEAKWRVKIGHAFLEKGHDIKGVVHVGANDGYEVEYYLKLGIEKVLCFEPYPLAIGLFKQKYASDIESGRVILIEKGLGARNERAKLRIAPDTGQSSSVLRVAEEFRSDSPFKDTEGDLGTVEIDINTWINFLIEHPTINPDDYDCLVVDVQGMELDALRGMGTYLKNFKYLNIECSEKAVYEGEARAIEVVRFLKEAGFHQDTEIEPHNDIMFTREDCL